MAQQMYMIELMIDKVSIFVSDDDPDTSTDKRFIVKVCLGPNEDVNFKENHLVDLRNDTNMIACEDQVYHKKWYRMIRVGKSYLFPSYPDQLVIVLAQFLIEVTLWTDGLNETRELVGNGIMKWDPKFYGYLKETANPSRLHDAFAIKQTCLLFHDLNTGRAGEVDIIIRLSALGRNITTEYQQIPEKEHFVFRTNKVPTMFKCQRTKGDDINFLMAGIVYESITLEDPTVVEKMNQRIEVCTELESCGHRDFGDKKRIPQARPLQKIKMRDIVGPCGNQNCVLAHKIKTYLRTLDIYKNETKGKTFTDKNEAEEGRNVCGSCGCKEERWHRDTCPSNKDEEKKPMCPGCGGIARSGETCEDRVNKVHVISSKNKQINYITSIIRDVPEKSLFGQTFIVNPCEIKYPNPEVPPQKCCACGKTPDDKAIARLYANNITTTRNMGNVSALVYNADIKTDNKNATKFCTDIPDEKDKECKCNPAKPTPPCKTFDCECLTRAAEKQSRRHHKSYCPAYKHKSTCPVTKMNDEEVPEFEEDEAEVLPYGLPPVQLGPCPVLGRPCSVPDGFARMYKTAAMPQQPLSYSDAGKVCCSAEFDRIKKAILEYTKSHEKEDDYRCLNKFNMDTTRKCCDKEQRLLALLGKSCCGSSKNLKIEKDQNE